MVQVTLITNGGQKNDIVSESLTLREIYNKHNVNYAGSVNTMNSEPVRACDLDKSLRELGVTDKVRLSSIVKMDNAAEIYVAGTCAVVKSGHKLETWEKCLAYKEDIGLFEEDGTPDFMAAIEEGPGSLNSHGVVWSDVPTEDGYACVTLLLDPSVEDKKDFVKETVGKDLLKLDILEKLVPEYAEQAEKDDAILEAKIKTI